MSLLDGMDGKAGYFEFWGSNQLIEAGRLNQMDIGILYALHQLFEARPVWPEKGNGVVLYGLGATKDASLLAVHVAPGIGAWGPIYGASGVGSMPSLGRMENEEVVGFTADDNNDTYHPLVGQVEIETEDADVKVRDPNTGVVTTENVTVRMRHKIKVVDLGSNNDILSLEDAEDAFGDNDIPIAVVKVLAGATGPGGLEVIDYRVPWMHAGEVIFRARVTSSGIYPISLDEPGTNLGSQKWEVATNLPEWASLELANNDKTSTGKWEIALKGWPRLLPHIGVDVHLESSFIYDADNGYGLGLLCTYRGYYDETDKTIYIERYGVSIDSNDAVRTSVAPEDGSGYEYDVVKVILVFGRKK